MSVAAAHTSRKNRDKTDGDNYAAFGSAHNYHGSKWEKINAGMITVPSFPSSHQASAILATD